MSISSKFVRIADLIKMSRKRGLVSAWGAVVNRYRYDHSVSQTLPIVSPTTPYHIQIEPSRVCNLRCKMCEYSYMENKGTVMRLEEFKKILAQFPALSSVDLTGIGEPFCNPDFMDMVRHAKNQGLCVEFVNNGNLLTEERMDALIEMQVDRIQFSIDASTKGTHEAIRLYSNFDRVLDAIKTLSEKVAKSGTGLPARLMNYTMSTENIEEAPQFISLADSVGVTDVMFRYMIFFEGSAYGDQDGIDSLDRESLSRIRDQILSESQKHSVNVDLDPLLAGTDHEPRICMRPWMNAYVDVFGNYYPCCLVTQRNEDISQYALGNLLTDKFEDIWNNELYRSLREGMAHPTQIPPLCEGCAMLKKVPGSTVKQSLGLDVVVND